MPRSPSHLLLRAALLSVATLLANPAVHAQANADTVELPLISGWYEGKPVRYVTTDVSDQKAAAEMQANYVPRLANAILPQPASPGGKSAVERIYSFVNFRQGGVLPSVPNPTGSGNADPNYSPLWQVHRVIWQAGRTPRLLTSEEQILAAEEGGDVKIEKTGIIVNCPVVISEFGSLPGIHVRPGGSAQR
ncbi:hypothetical protein J8I26_15325 [Herbaspirillum sp. LeCh32-8]|uniref:DUF7482 domain-containing protein n=1 Tax=Herbaspirillum sp. LeCh32-8 TaxID=2821356 RepID=UPI001AE724F3|nr:hypothetical protein [Herbaspirillum sp. LeCh32-8]MBP0599488.1 hypothetical protein [Herbaspirillum sp. LeCh32-8]